MTTMPKLFAHSLSRPRAPCARPRVPIFETATSSMTDMPKLVSGTTLPRFHSPSGAHARRCTARQCSASTVFSKHDRGRQEHCRQLAPENRLANQHASSSTSTSTLRTDTPSLSLQHYILQHYSASTLHLQHYSLHYSLQHYIQRLNTRACNTTVCTTACNTIYKALHPATLQHYSLQHYSLLQHSTAAFRRA